MAKEKVVSSRVATLVCNTVPDHICSKISPPRVARPAVAASRRAARRPRTLVQRVASPLKMMDIGA